MVGELQLMNPKNNSTFNENKMLELILKTLRHYDHDDDSKKNTREKKNNSVKKEISQK